LRILGEHRPREPGIRRLILSRHGVNRTHVGY
jgi:hypothetical protein